MLLFPLLFSKHSLLIYCHLAVRGNFPIRSGLVEFLARPVLDILTPSCPSSTTIQFLLKLMDSLYPRSIVHSANGMEIVSSLFQHTAGEQRNYAALAVFYLSREADVISPLTIEIVAFISPSIMSLPITPHMFFLDFI